MAAVVARRPLDRVLFDPRPRLGDLHDGVERYPSAAIAVRPGFDGVAVPSPDGRWIAFQRGTSDSAGSHWDLFLVDTLGRNQSQLTSNRWSSQVPSWTTGGKELVFYANPEGREQLFVLDIASRDVRPLTRSGGNDTAPSVSPDGRAVAFNSDRDGLSDLYLLDIRSGAVRRLTTGLQVRSQPGWSRDGRQLLFSALETGVDEVYRIGQDGSGLVRLTKGWEGVR